MLPKEEYLYTVQCITAWTFLHCVCLKHYVPCIIQAKQFGPVQRWTLDKTRHKYLYDFDVLLQQNEDVLFIGDM